MFINPECLIILEGFLIHDVGNFKVVFQVKVVIMNKPNHQQPRRPSFHVLLNESVYPGNQYLDLAWYQLWRRVSEHVFRGQLCNLEQLQRKFTKMKVTID